MVDVGFIPRTRESCEILTGTRCTAILPIAVAEWFILVWHAG